MASIEKIVISDHLTGGKLTLWNNSRIIKRANACREITAPKQQPGRDILVIISSLLWNDRLIDDLVKEPHIAFFPLIAGADTPLFDGRPPVSLNLIHTGSWQGSGNILAC